MLPQLTFRSPTVHSRSEVQLPHAPTAHPSRPRRPLWRALLAGLLGLALTGYARAGDYGHYNYGDYAVRPGDTAYSVARAAGISVADLLSLNRLGSSDLRVGQLLRLSAPTHTVLAGETAYGVAREAGLSVPELLALNNLTASDLRVGQLLRLSGLSVGAAPPGTGTGVQAAPAAAPLRVASAPAPVGLPAGVAFPVMTPPQAEPAAQATPLMAAPPLPPPGDWRSTAMDLLGVPYVYGGSTRSGLDCSGLVNMVFAGLSPHLPRQSAGQARAGLPVAPGDLQAGDLLFFDTEGLGQVTHVGIYLGGGSFIHASSFAGKVSLDRVDERYYAARLLTARRVLPPPAQEP